MATGVKTSNGVIGMDSDLRPLVTILEEAKMAGKSVGLVTTTQISHATPAAFASHVSNRDMMTEIASQYLTTEVDLLLGGGEDEFLPSGEIGCYPQVGERQDSRNLTQEFILVGGEYVCDETSFDQNSTMTTNRLLGLFADEGMTAPYTPSLTKMTQKAIDLLSRNPNGFFLLKVTGFTNPKFIGIKLINI